MQLALLLVFGALGTLARLWFSWIHRWALGMGKKNDIRNEPDPPKFILDLYSAL